MRTVIVLSGLAEVTMPVRTFGRPGPCSRGAATSAAGALAALSARLAFCLAREARRALAFFFLRASRSATRCSIVCWSAIVALPPQLALYIDAALVCDGECAREVALRSVERSGVLQLPGGVLEAQVEYLLAGVAHGLD